LETVHPPLPKRHTLCHRCLTCIRQHTSAYASIRPHTSAYRYTRHFANATPSATAASPAYVSIRQHTSAYVRIRSHTSAYRHTCCHRGLTCIRQHTSTHASIRPHTSAYVRIRQHTGTPSATAASPSVISSIGSSSTEEASGPARPAL
jgi:hypothetical protein